MAAESSNFVQPAIPKFDGHYDHWSMLMENFLRSKEYWSLVENGIPAAAEGIEPTEAQQKAIADHKLKDLKVKNYLFQAIDRNIMETILNKETGKHIWDSMKQKYQGSTRVKRAQLQALRREFEVLQMKEGESVDEYFARTLTIANKMKIHGESMKQVVIIEKILRSMTSRFDYVVCSVEEFNDLDTLTIDELQSSLLVHEQRMNGHGRDEQALKVTYNDQVVGRGGRGRGAFRGRGRGRGRQAFNKAIVECYKCHQLGHFQYECPKWEKGAHYAELDEKEEMLLMSYVELNQSSKEDVWFLDSGCSNHMCGNKLWFSDLDEEFRQSVKLGNNSKMTVLGKGNIRMQVAGVTQVITDVFYIPELRNNLLSVGQLQEKGVAILIQHGECRVYHPEKGLIMQTSMSANRMFILPARVMPKAPTCFQITLEDNTHLWHCRYGHLSFKGLRTLQYKEMVRGLPQLKASSKVCTNCMVGKQHRDAIPKRSLWRASQRLQLVHADICGPIKPVSNSKKRGGEFTSLEFNAFCKTNGISRQLTAAYTPQQNGVAEHKNRTIMNMVRSMLSEKQVPKNFWPEAVNWTAHVLNRSPTLAVKGVTPKEAWSGVKPNVDYFRVFGCIGHVHVPDNKRKKLDDKSFQCVLLGNEEGSEDDAEEGGAVEGREREDSLSSSESLGSLSESLGENSGVSGESSPSSQQGRNRRVPFWMEDYVSGGEFSEGDVEHNLVLFTSTADPTTFEEAVQSSKWRAAMDLEIEAIERNETWELTDLPEGVKKIGVKWVFKTKLNENGKWDTIRMVIALAARNGWSVYQLDVKSAFLHGELNEAVFIEQPQGYEKKGEEHKVYKLKKALYGLKQAPRAWYSRIEAYFIKEGFERCSCDHTLFIKTGDGGKILIVSLYVDDLIFTGNDESMFVKFKNSMKLEFDMTDLGKMKYFLGMEVLQNSEGIYISQRKYAKEVLERFGMEKSNSVKNPIVPGDRLTKNEGGVKVDATKFMASPTEMHLQAAKRVLRDVDDRKSTSGYVFLLSEGAVAWSSKKQPVVTLSTTEAEFVAAASCACQGVWMRRVLEKLGHSQGKCTTVLCDNNSTIKLSKNPVMHGRSKHIDVRFHFLRDLTREGVVELKHCGTQEQVADIMTKPLKLDVFLKLRELLGVSVVPRVN
ncbi:Retrovirus-related Pol polyprotein from transposon TNT 1-94 [Vitis vinifera]|uniref:Retrovirus-related Pol polyprotein from transposon TNT 1-94 n=1 Tax=Vitis vinifera TaxID=29760 RepID=A0A438K8W5_VITVI|nr:Retrovirus-related Pol polyprotein from transposon TNT 1-94 [Vitis vinifera]